MKHTKPFNQFTNEAKKSQYPQEVENIINELSQVLPFKNIN